MKFEKKEKAKKRGHIIGFICMFFIFTTILFFVLRLTHKLPANWSYFNVEGITCCIALVGEGLRWWLK